MHSYPSKIRVGVAGATGFAGQELVAILARHPYVELVAGMSSSADSATRPLPRVTSASTTAPDAIFRAIAALGERQPLNAATGAITVADATKLDYETTPTFTLTIQASDGTNTDTATITVNLNNLNVQC